jgi:hypothetical protein
MMHQELADEVVLIAAPIFAALLTPYVAAALPVSADTLKELRHHAIQQALALRLDVLETPVSTHTAAG